MGWKIIAVCSALSFAFGVFDYIAGNSSFGLVDFIVTLFHMGGAIILVFYAFNIVVLDAKLLSGFSIIFTAYVLVQITYALWVAFPLIANARSHMYAAGVIIPLSVIIILDILTWIAVRRYSKGFILRGAVES
ncbi:hypothetical protein [Rhizobium sp. YTU87027]|uniref:hypothetical protein n=1 Tax=Rhizobium sp. YTU87027 TaxID=3417741 RepID=UPI003D68289A